MNSKQLLTVLLVLLAASSMVLGKPSPDPEPGPQPEPNPIAAPQPAAVPDPAPIAPMVAMKGAKAVFKVGKLIARAIKRRREKKKQKELEKQKQQQQQQQQMQNSNAIGGSSQAGTALGSPQSKQNIMINLVFGSEFLQRVLSLVGHSSGMFRNENLNDVSKQIKNADHADLPAELPGNENNDSINEPPQDAQDAQNE